MKLKPTSNGNVIADAFTEDALVDGTLSMNVEKCPNLYGTNYEIWESKTLAEIFTSGTSVEPLADLVFASTLNNNYYDTYTGTITVGTGSNITITNTGETTVDIYVVDLTTVFTTEPTETQCDAMAKMFLLNGTGSELITLEEVFYVDYTNSLVHNLTDIYGTGNEPTLETHETLIPQYTNTVLKAKAFSENLQQEYMQVKLTTPLYTGGMTYAELFDGYQLISNGDFSDGTTGWSVSGTYHSIENETLKSNLTISGSLSFHSNTSFNLNDEIYLFANINNTSATIISFSEMTTRTTDVVRYDYITLGSGWLNHSSIRDVSANGKYLGFTITSVGSALTYFDNIYAFNITALKALELYSPLYNDTFDNLSDVEIKAQLDLWVKFYALITGNVTDTGTEMLNDRYYMDYDNAKAYDLELVSAYAPSVDEVVYEGLSYRDIFESGNLVENPLLTDGTSWFNDSGLTLSDDKAYYLDTVNSAGIYQDILLEIGVNYYISIQIESAGTPLFGLQYRNSNYMMSYTYLYSLGQLSYIIEAVQTDGIEFNGRTSGAAFTMDNIFVIPMSIFTTAPSQAQLDTWLATYLTRSNKKALVESILNKDITLTSIPVKAKIYKDRLVILGDYVTVGE